jgi:multidrug efflux pump subunit AcrB
LLVPATTVPVTIIGAFAAMIALGFSINLMTLFALVLAIGGKATWKDRPLERQRFRL